MRQTEALVCCTNRKQNHIIKLLFYFEHYCYITNTYHQVSLVFRRTFFATNGKGGCTRDVQAEAEREAKTLKFYRLRIDFKYTTLFYRT